MLRYPRQEAHSCDHISGFWPLMNWEFQLGKSGSSSMLQGDPGFLLGLQRCFGKVSGSKSGKSRNKIRFVYFFVSFSFKFNIHAYAHRCPTSQYSLFALTTRKPYPDSQGVLYPGGGCLHVCLDSSLVFIRR